MVSITYSFIVVNIINAEIFLHRIILYYDEMSQKLANEQNLSEPLIISTNSITFRGQKVSIRVGLKYPVSIVSVLLQLDDSVTADGVKFSVVKSEQGKLIQRFLG